MLKEDKIKKRKERHAITQEDFTPDCVVEVMLAQLPEDSFTNMKRTILDTSCGIGNFLVAILIRRLENCTTAEDAFLAVKTLFGVELMADNVHDCRQRLYDTIVAKFPELPQDAGMNYKIRATIRNRIKWRDSLKFDYKWDSLALKPRKGHFNVDFYEVRRNEDTKYPMWYKEVELFEPSLFDGLWED